MRATDCSEANRTAVTTGNAPSRSTQVTAPSSAKEYTERKRIRILISDNEESLFKTVGNFVFYPVNAQATSYQLLDYIGNSDTIVLPDDCDGIPYVVYNYALAFNDELKSVTFPSTVEQISSLALFRSNNVETLAVASGNAKYRSQNNCIISIGERATDRNKLVIGCKTSVIPTDGSIVDSIGSYAFKGNTEIKNLTIPSNITDIESSAFEDCIGLIRTDGIVNYVDKWAISFEYKGSDTATIEFAEGTVGIAGDFCGYFSNNSERKIGAVVINADLKYISDNAFYGCTNLTSVTFNDGLVAIGNSAFSQCSKITEIIIPDSVTSVGSAFSRCTSLEYAKLSENLTKINSYMFNGCTNLKEVVIPSGVRDIEHYAFYNCNALRTVYFCGDADAWKTITKQSNNTALNSATIVYYSESNSSGCWHYGADGKPTLWA